MPCYQVNRMSVKIEAADKVLLEQALLGLGMKYFREGDRFKIDAGAGYIEIDGGQARLSKSLQGKLNEIKQAYSREVIKEACLSYNFIVEEEDEQNRMTIRRY